MATLKENLIKEILEINDSRVLESIRNLIHSIDDGDPIGGWWTATRCREVMDGTVREGGGG